MRGRIAKVLQKKDFSTENERPHGNIAKISEILIFQIYSKNSLDKISLCHLVVIES